MEGGFEHQGGEKGKEEEKRAMASKSLEPREEWEEEDEERWNDKKNRDDNQWNGGRYGRD